MASVAANNVRLNYKISFGPDYTLQWDPPVNSKELAISLSYHFPLEPNLESKMRAAMRKFIEGDQSTAIEEVDGYRYLTPEDDETSRLFPATIKPSIEFQTLKHPTMLKVLSWDPEKGSKGGFKREVKRRRYNSEEGAKVAKNRGSACDEHRRQKLKVSVK